MVEIGDVIEAMEEIRTVYKDRSKILSTEIKQLHMGPRRLGRCEEMFMEISYMESQLGKFLFQYRGLLPKDVDNDPIYPEANAEAEGGEFVYTEDNINRLTVEMDLTLHNLQKLFVRFKMSQTELVQTWIKKHAQLECLRDNNMAEAYARELEQEDSMENTLDTLI